MKKSSDEPWIENVGETVLLEPAFKQNMKCMNIDDETLCGDEICLKSRVGNSQVTET